MRSYLFIAAIFISFLTYNAASAQKVGLGVKLGADISQMSGFSLNESFQGHFLVGLQTHVRVGRIGLQVEANLTQTQITTGSNFSSAFGNFIKSTASAAAGTDILLTELGIPAMLEVRLIGPLRIEAGVQYSLIIDAKDKNDYLIDANKVVADGYMSGLVGAKLEFKKIQVGARYLQGFGNMNETAVREEWTNGRYQVYASYLLFK